VAYRNTIGHCILELLYKEGHGHCDCFGSLHEVSADSPDFTRNISENDVIAKKGAKLLYKIMK
jgi:hypothetical protein